MWLTLRDQIMSSLVPFSFDSHQIRVVTDDCGLPWFVAKDVASALGYADTAKAVTTHCKRAKSLSDIDVSSSGSVVDTQTKLVPESDVFALIFSSRMPKGSAARDAMMATLSDAKSILRALRSFEIPDDLPDMYVYAIREKDTGNIKLGISRDPESRLRQLQTGNSSELELVAFRKAENRFADERALHADAEAYRLRGEWFEGSAMGVMQS